MKPDTFIRFMGQEKASAILRTDSQEKAARAMEAALRAGFRIIEFTLTVPGAYELIREFSAREGVAVGAGTVLDVAQAERSVDAGAVYLVSPVVDPEVIAAGRSLGVATMPGTHTATEMFAAHRAGADFCKLFPAPASGPAYVKALLGPMPFLKIVPTNGVDHLNAGQWMAAGCFGVGFVATLFEPGFIAAEDWEAIERRAGQCLRAVQST